ncbi:MAG: extracellular solute-binding protein [bacterium]|nr:extracellular solute-binding protein [bacterium]
MPARKTIIRFATLAALLLTMGVGCRVASPEARQASQPIELTWWRVWDPEDTVKDIVQQYQARHPNIKITYRQLRFEEYEKELLNAWAEGRGPDVFSIHNTWVGAYEGKLLPLPETITIPEIVPTGPSCGKQQTKTVLQTYRTLKPQDVNNRFVEAASHDAVRNGAVQALPMGLDTMVMYYNKSLLDAAGIPVPPRTWDEFVATSQRLTVITDRGDVVQSGGALGRADNVDRASDILALLMMQSGAPMIEDGKINFDNAKGASADLDPGLRALRFYTDFANPVKESYSWNEKQPRSLDAFIQGKAAFFLGYSFHLPLIKARAPKLVFGVASVPQLTPERPLTVANYWLEGVFSNTKHKNEAWDFVMFATNAKQVPSYLNAAQKPTALRELVTSQLENATLAPFASGVLSAQSWYTGKDGNAMEQIMKDMITQTNQATSRIEDIIRLGAQRIQRTL